MNEDKDYKPLTHDQLLAEAIAMIQRAEEWQIEKAIKAAMAVENKKEV